MIGPGSTIGILGGGQLGRMTAMAAARLGYRCIILAPEPECVAADVAAAWIKADYRDEAAFRDLARRVDVVTIEFENVPAGVLRKLAELVPTRPAADVLDVTQDRLVEKRFLRDLGMRVAPFLPVDDPAGLAAARLELGVDAILKTRRMGYDGKGQVRLNEIALDEALREIGAVPAILERRVDFVCELSVITARSPSGTHASYPPVVNEHRSQVLQRTIAPGDLEPRVAARAVEMAEAVAGAVRLEGLLAVEMFLDQDGDLLINELAPRPHNSGHWTIDACHVDQFEQLVRAVCDLPLGDPSPFAEAVMENLLGDEVHSWPQLLGEPGVRLHLYGKSQIRDGRKMGHVTRPRRFM